MTGVRWPVKHVVGAAVGASPSASGGYVNEYAGMSAPAGHLRIGAKRREILGLQVNSVRRRRGCVVLRMGGWRICTHGEL